MNKSGKKSLQSNKKYTTLPLNKHIRQHITGGLKEKRIILLISIKLMVIDKRQMNIQMLPVLHKTKWGVSKW